MFKQLHSDKKEDKEAFIQQCMAVATDEECDDQELRFLFEEVCKVIAPEKPEPNYQLNLNKAPSQEFYIRGKMNKNPYSSKQLGKTMADVRSKICKEIEVDEELIELIVANQIIGMEVPIKLAYEKVWWPYLCRQRNPDDYQIPSIEEASPSQLGPMSVTYRLAGIDGEATEDRVESLAEDDEGEQ